jgi:hypothetical protein
MNLYQGGSDIYFGGNTVSNLYCLANIMTWEGNADVGRQDVCSTVGTFILVHDNTVKSCNKGVIFTPGNGVGPTEPGQEILINGFICRNNTYTNNIDNALLVQRCNVGNYGTSSEMIVWENEVATGVPHGITEGTPSDGNGVYILYNNSYTAGAGAGAGIQVLGSAQIASVQIPGPYPAQFHGFKSRTALAPMKPRLVPTVFTVSTQARRSAAWQTAPVGRSRTRSRSFVRN